MEPMTKERLSRFLSLKITTKNLFVPVVTAMKSGSPQRGQSVKGPQREAQVQNYTKMIQENPEWEFAGIFADEGISDTSVLHREHFLEMIEKCKVGEIDLCVIRDVEVYSMLMVSSITTAPILAMLADTGRICVGAIGLQKR